MTKIIVCSLCGEIKNHEAKGLCKSCYGKKQYKMHKKERNKYNKRWRKNNKGYSTKWTHLNNKNKPMGENKQCSSYLGVHISEQVLSKVFKNVKMMTYGNKGFDFICNNGFKIDIKSSCRNISNDKADYWVFNINKNIIPNYFLCLAFDNRDSLNPEHIWLIPGEDINNKIRTSISESTINKWNKYTLNIDKVINQCNNMR